MYNLHSVWLKGRSFSDYVSFNLEVECDSHLSDFYQLAENVYFEDGVWRWCIYRSNIFRCYRALRKEFKAKGADSFWYKDVSKEALIDVIDRTMEGEHLFPDKSPVVKLGRASSADFTAKEIEVLRLVCDGLEYSEIAENLCISVNTVKTHVSHILQRTGYANKTRLAIAVTNKKFIIPSIPEDNESE